MSAPDDTNNINFTLLRGGSISGQVIDKSGNPVNNADITAYLNDDFIVQYSSETDAKGNYMITSLKSGKYRIVVKARGWANQEYSTYVDVNAPNDTFPINFILYPEGSISGKVLDDQGNPITNASVCAMPVNSNSIRNFYTVNIDGNYLLTGLDSGDYIVEVQAEGWINQKRADPVTVTAPQKSENINFTLKKGGSISGRVLDEQGQPVFYAHVYILNAIEGIYSCNTDDAGYYNIKSLPSGSYEVNVSADDLIFQKYSNVEVIAPNDTGDINVALQRGGSISGRVVDRSGSPIKNATIHATGTGGSLDYTTSDETGYYKTYGLPEGNYQVEVQAKGWKRQTYASDVNVEILNDSGGINFTLLPATPIANLSAKLEDGKVILTFSPPTGAFGVFVVYKSGFGTYQSAVTETLNENSDSATVSGLTNGKSYTFKLVVFGGVYEGESNEVTITPTGEVDQCFIATAAFGSKFEPAVVLLREFRDQYLLTNALGKKFVQFYYRTSPPIAHYIADNMILKYLVRALLIPVVGLVYLLFHPIYGSLLIAFLILMLGFRKKQWV